MSYQGDDLKAERIINERKNRLEAGDEQGRRNDGLADVQEIAPVLENTGKRKLSDLFRFPSRDSLFSLLDKNWCWVVFGGSVAVLIIAGVFIGLYSKPGWLASVPVFGALFFLVVVSFGAWCFNLYKKEWSLDNHHSVSNSTVERGEGVRSNLAVQPTTPAVQQPSHQYGAVTTSARNFDTSTA